MRLGRTNSRLSESEIAEVREVYAECESYAEASQTLNISAGTISQIIRGLGRFKGEE